MTSTQLNSFDACNKYAEDVATGQVVTSKLVRLACERHLRDLDNGHERGLAFDRKRANRALKFFGQLKHTQGEWSGKRFVLEPWQSFVVCSLFGWLGEDGLRRYREAYVEIARKNGKSTLFAGIGLYLTVGDSEPGAQVYSFATTKEQAKIVFDEAVRMSKESPRLSEILTVYGGLKPNALIAESTYSRFLPLASEDKKLDGFNVHGGLADELHEHPSRAMWDVIKDGTTSRRQPLMLAITTAGHDRHSFCYQQHEYAERVLAGLVQDDSFFAFVASLDRDAQNKLTDNWKDETVWVKANPNLGVSAKLSKLRAEAKRAAEDPAALNNFLRKHLNVWTEQDVRWMPMDKWAACGNGDPIAERKRLLASLKGCPCFGALDLSQTQDLTAFVLLFPPYKDRSTWVVVPWFFVPEDNIEKRAKRDRVPYDVWKAQGFLVATPGAVIDYRFIRATIERECKGFQIREVAYDRRFAQDVVNELTESGFTCVDTPQGYKLSAALNHLYTLVLQKEIEHVNNPVLTWNISNMVVKLGAWGEIAPDKSKATERIDGAVALAMAVNSALLRPAPKRMPTVHVLA